MLCMKHRYVARAIHAKHGRNRRRRPCVARNPGVFSCKTCKACSAWASGGRGPPIRSSPIRSARPVGGQSRLLQRTGPHSSPAPMRCTKPRCAARALHAPHATHGRLEGGGRQSGGPISAKGAARAPDRIHRGPPDRRPELAPTADRSTLVAGAHALHETRVCCSRKTCNAWAKQAPAPMLCMSDPRAFLVQSMGSMQSMGRQRAGAGHRSGLGDRSGRVAVGDEVAGVAGAAMSGGVDSVVPWARIEAENLP
jgi:hypothetical protein